ncbi:molecular chaperone HtpG [candidate division KSB1 bacterium]|nr:molecular chaperone HtpG [candidate division KSB1 bacterium]
MTDKQTQKPEKFKFKAEVSQLLDILTHSLYTHRDVFIRELISNSSDALDKVRFKDVKGEAVADADQALEIHIELDKDNNTFTIRDTGIGMTHDELVKNIGTIARSGTTEFVKMLAEENQKDVNLIGRFGVGFYSVFMAGEEVEITTKSGDPDEPGWQWISDGKGAFQINPAENVKRGTTIKVSLREDAKEFSEEYSVKTAIEKYSSFVPFPVFMGKEQVNKIAAIWREPKSNVKEDQYKEFFKFIAHQGDDPVTWLHFSADVPLQFHSLLFVPKTNLELMGFGREDDGVHLFVKRVLVDAHAKDLLPPYLRFARGVIESDDLPLNISRETLQENPYVIKIRNTVIKRFLSHLQEVAEKKPEDYLEFWKQHGRIVKEGYNDYQHKDQVAELFLFNSSKCADEKELIGLSTYVERMHEKQEEILFFSGPSREAIESNPAIEIFKAKGIEVLYTTDPIDEFVLPGLMMFKEKMIKSADQADITKLEDVKSEDNADEKDEKAPDKKDVDKLARRIKDILGDRVETVKLSERLVDSPAVLVGSSNAMSGQMEKIMQMMNKDAAPPSAKIMEINQKHPIIANMLTIYQKDTKSPLLSKLVEGLYSSIQILDGTVEHPQVMAASIQALLSETLELTLKTKPVNKAPQKKAAPAKKAAPKKK